MAVDTIDCQSPIPRAIAIGKSSATATSPISLWMSIRRAARRLRAQSSIRTILASTSASNDAVQRLRFEHPEVRLRVIQVGQGECIFVLAPYLRTRQGHPCQRRR